MIVGIDLGTTNSLVAVYTEDGPKLIKNALGEYLTPSVVGVDDHGHIITGRLAKERLITHPALTIANFKRYMGTNRKIELGNKSFRPEEISSLLLRSLKADAEEHCGEKIDEAVITVPAYFNDTQRKATKIAGELAGLKVERLLNEPTAAALAYGLHKNSEQRYLVFDLGGGTFDISIVEYFEGILEVHASSGDNYLGGNEFTEKIYNRFYEQLNQQGSFDKNNALLNERLWKSAETAKLLLSERQRVEQDLTWNDKQYKLHIDEDTLESLSTELLERLRKPVKKALRDSRISISDISEIVLVGGATRMPLIRKLTTRLFERFPAIELDPDHVVALGAAVQAGLQSKNEALSDTVLTDVCPYTLGIEVSEKLHQGYQGGFYLPIIERNNYIPISRVKDITTIADYQTHLELNIYQGESPLVEKNIKLGVMNVKIPKSKAGEEVVDVRFTYDVNGLLEVETHVRSTGKKETITIEQNPGVLSKSEISHRLKELEKLKIHPRDQDKNKLIKHRAERMYEECLGDQRAYIQSMLAEFISILESQDEAQIKDARKRMTEILDAMEYPDSLS